MPEEPHTGRPRGRWSPPESLARPAVDERHDVLVLLRYERDEVGPAVAVEVGDRDVDAAGRASIG